MTRVDAYTCREAFARLEDYVDRELSPDEVRLVEEHLAVCEVCASEFSFEARVLGAVREKLRQIELPGRLKERVARLIAAERAKPSDSS